MYPFDFTRAYYIKLLRAFRESGYEFSPVNDYIQKPTNDYNHKVVILRHDIDKRPDLAYEMAIIESKLSIRGTYYFRIHPSSFNENIIKNISRFGHEIGYHYEDLTSNYGDYELAIINFRKNLEKFRSIVPISTVCMDGRPLSPFSNLDLWKKYHYSAFDLNGEPYLNFDFTRMLYLTDASRGWNRNKFNVRDKVNDEFEYYNHTTERLIKDIKNENLPNQIMLTIHPQRWHYRTLPWIKELIFQNIKNLAKWILIKYREFYTKKPME